MHSWWGDHADHDLDASRPYERAAGSGEGKLLVQFVSDDLCKRIEEALTNIFPTAVTPTLRRASAHLGTFPRLETHWATRRIRCVPATNPALNRTSRALQGWTAVGGVNWVDVQTTVHNKSLLLTYNYAYGGATINASLVQPYEPTVLSLIDQVNQFMDQAADKPAFAPWTSENALFSVWIGINDIGNSYYQSGDRDA